jgi:hypothetical protein
LNAWTLRAVGAVIAAALLVSSSDCRSPPQLTGTFIQLTHAHLDWDDAQWRALFERFAALCLTELVVQWTRYDDTSFCDNSGGPCLVETVLRHADRLGLRVLVGLVQRSDYWKRIKAPVEERRAYLKELRDASLATARELAPRVEQHPSFGGWYICEEIDDVSWNGPAKRRVLVEHLADLSLQLRGLVPGEHRIGLSGFSNGALDKDGLQALWMDVLGASAIDILLFQDGIGVGKLPFAELDGYLAAVQQATRWADRSLWVVVEIFEQVEGNTGGFAARPAPLARIQSQLAVAAAHADTLVAFSVPEYMTELGGAAAAELFRRYREEVIAPKGPPAELEPLRAPPRGRRSAARPAAPLP